MSNILKTKTSCPFQDQSDYIPITNSHENTLHNATSETIENILPVENEQKTDIFNINTSDERVSIHTELTVETEPFFSVPMCVENSELQNQTHKGENLDHSTSNQPDTSTTPPKEEQQKSDLKKKKRKKANIVDFVPGIPELLNLNNPLPKDSTFNPLLYAEYMLDHPEELEKLYPVSYDSWDDPPDLSMPDSSIESIVQVKTEEDFEDGTIEMKTTELTSLI
eukprot:TRINITY_DN11444_c0_g1_i2.p1 TRINITY_DN11444_c0_g1~~TRINITY_DN11444_c0_g1_i2.p1  ORF type:complete len:232 (+),score=50.43 TRINITY_DN11444_c0_g1_i2:28-696(+)